MWKLCAALGLGIAVGCGGSSSSEPDALSDSCGNGGVDGLEYCDGQDLRGETCASLGLGGGTLGCLSDCRFDFSGCNIQPTCGNGAIEGAETCDDGDTVSGDGCDDQCRIETPPDCGDGTLDVDLEQCDDGNTDAGDGCDANCRLEPVGQSCGDSVMDSLEKCDPPEQMPADGDGCNATCNLTGQVTTLLSGIQANAIASDNTYIWLSIHDCATGCGIARIDLAACIAAPATAACQPTFISGGNAGNCACSTGSCPTSDLVPTPAVVDGDTGTATFDFAGTMTTDGTTIWIAQQHLLREVDIATGAVATVAGTPGSCAAIDGNGSSALFHDIRGLTYWNGLVYLLDSCEDVLRSYDPSTGDVVTLSGTRQPDPDVTQTAPYTCPAPRTTAPCFSNTSCGPTSTPTAGLGLAAVFASPRYLTADYQGNLYLIDTNGQAIFRYNTATTQADILIAQAAAGLPAPYVDGPAASSTISRPRGIISDGTSVYFGEQTHGTVRQLELVAMTTSTFVGTDGCTAGAATAPRDGLGADTTQVWSTGSQCVGSPPDGTPIFNPILGSMTFNFMSRSIYLLDGDVLRRIE